MSHHDNSSSTFLAFLKRHDIHDLHREVRRKYEKNDFYNFTEHHAIDDQMLEEEIAVLKIPYDNLMHIIDIVSEWETLCQNSETARLLYEARFINRLHNGIK